MSGSNFTRDFVKAGQVLHLLGLAVGADVSIASNLQFLHFKADFKPENSHLNNMSCGVKKFVSIPKISIKLLPQILIFY